MLIENCGEIKSISLPDRWVEKPPASEPLSSRSLRRFHPPGDDSLQVRFVNSTHRHSSAIGETFRQCLDKPAHSLSAQELDELLPVLQELADKRWFEITSAQTFDVSGRRVLWVEGRWNQDSYWSGTMFVDAGGNGRTVEQIVCVARLDCYEENQQLFRQILNSVEWIA